MDERAEEKKPEAQRVHADAREVEYHPAKHPEHAAKPAAA